MEDKQYEEIPSSFLAEKPVQSPVTPFGASEGFLVHEDEIGDLLSQGGSPASEEKVLPIKQKKEESKKEGAITELEVASAEPDEAEESALGRIFSEGEEEEKTPETPNPVVETPAEQEEEETNTFQALSESLLEYGIFTKVEGQEEEVITSGEQLKERWEKEKELQVNSRIYDFLMQKHGQEGVEVFNSIFVNGASPKDYLAKFDTLQSVKEMDLSSEANQEYIFKAYQRKAGWSEEKINKYLDKYKTLGELEETAKDLHEELLKQEEIELSEMAEEAELREQQRVQNEQFYRQKVADILTERLKKGDFDGIPVTQKVAKETSSYLTDKRYRLPSGETLTTFDRDILELRKPENYELKIKLALLLRQGFDLSNIKAKAVTETKDKYFDKVIRENRQQSKKNTVNINQNPSSFTDGLKYKK